MSSQFERSSKVVMQMNAGIVTIWIFITKNSTAASIIPHAQLSAFSNEPR